MGTGVGFQTSLQQIKAGGTKLKKSIIPCLMSLILPHKVLRGVVVSSMRLTLPYDLYWQTCSRRGLGSLRIQRFRLVSSFKCRSHNK